MSAKPKAICLHCALPVYCKHLCRRHYKKMLAIKNGTYKLEYLKRKADPDFIERKKMMDQIYRDRKRAGEDTRRKTNDNSLINQDWQAYSKQWALKNSYGKTKALRRHISFSEHRDKVIAYYSKGTNACASCGVADKRVLQIDHINNDGASHRKEMGQLSPIWWIVKNGYPDGFQILCANCNYLKEVEHRNSQFANRNLG